MTPDRISIFADTYALRRREGDVERSALTVLAAVVLTGLVAFAVGVLVGRWFIVAVAALAWPVWALGIWFGAWGYGFGRETEGWIIVTVVALYAAGAAAGASLGVRSRQLCAARRGPHSAALRPQPRASVLAPARVFRNGT